MPEAAALQRDRRRFHAHTATALLGIAGWLMVAAFNRIIVAALIPWLLIACSLLLTASGVLAIMVQRTFISGPVEVTDDGPHADQGDALATPGLHTLDLAPAYTRAVAPYAFFLVGLGFLGGSIYWAFTGTP